MDRSRMVRGASLSLIVLVAWSAAATDLDALRDTTPAERAKAQTAMMQAKLGLTEAQVPTIAAINQKYAERMEPVIKGSSGSLAKALDARAIEKQKEGELEQALSAEQFRKFLASKDAMRAEFLDRVKEQRAQGAP